MLIPSSKLRDKLWEWWMFGAGWLWLARALNVAGAVNFILFVWTFFSPSLYWLLFFFMSLTSFFVAAKLKRRSVAAPARMSGRAGETAALGAAGRSQSDAAAPPRAMFDREGRTPLERVFTQDEDREEDAAPRRRAGG